ncbi:hypothetical protein WJX72_011717 [[Myrmecia] bisecta]|uniref:Uncharacterized protein n=1 Tax=[Myrmecia] bisecta TaxID=41462 RepID=A0AAW1QU62_9CHLO
MGQLYEQAEHVVVLPQGLGLPSFSPGRLSTRMTAAKRNKECVCSVGQNWQDLKPGAGCGNRFIGEVDQDAHAHLFSFDREALLYAISAQGTGPHYGHGMLSAKLRSARRGMTTAEEHQFYEVASGSTASVYALLDGSALVLDGKLGVVELHSQVEIGTLHYSKLVEQGAVAARLQRETGINHFGQTANEWTLREVAMLMRGWQTMFDRDRVLCTLGLLAADGLALDNLEDASDADFALTRDVVSLVELGSYDITDLVTKAKVRRRAALACLGNVAGNYTKIGMVLIDPDATVVEGVQKAEKVCIS